MSFVEILKVIVLGIVEGFTEWLPISSTGHMILVDEIIHLEVSEAYREVFMVVIQLGAILAVLILYFHKLNPFSSRKSDAQKRGTLRLWGKILVACIPAAVIGLPLDNFMNKLMNGYVVSAMLIIYGVFFIRLENRNRNSKFPIERVTQISFQTAWISSEQGVKGASSILLDGRKLSSSRMLISVSSSVLHMKWVTPLLLLCV